MGHIFPLGVKGGTVRWPMSPMGVAWLLVGLVYLQKFIHASAWGGTPGSAGGGEVASVPPDRRAGY